MQVDPSDEQTAVTVCVSPLKLIAVGPAAFDPTVSQVCGLRFAVSAATVGLDRVTNA